MIKDDILHEKLLNVILLIAKIEALNDNPTPSSDCKTKSSNDDSTLIDDDSFSIDDIEYVEPSPLDSELVSSEVMEIVIPEVGVIDADILLTIKDDILRENLLNINLLIANIEALKDNPTPYFDFMTKTVSRCSSSILRELSGSSVDKMGVVAM
nr:hypothetical protein [Tanacetum cinerariifolium]